jgi:hypothetical protein
VVVSSLVAAGVPALSHPPAAAGWLSASHGIEVWTMTEEDGARMLLH